MKKENSKQINFNPRDWKAMHDLMDRHDEFKFPLFGSNEEGEDVMISINENCIVTSTNQKNGWVRENIYYRDYTTEELFHGKWR